MAGLYTTAQLLPVLRGQRVLPSFWLKFYPHALNFETDTIALDKVSDNYKRIAPFVAPNLQGVVQRHKGYDTRSFKPAYIKIKDVVEPSMVMPRLAGEALGTGSLTNEQRRAILIAEMLKQQNVRIENTWEVMAAQATIYGYVDVSAPDYPAVRVDFRRDASLTITADWTTAGLTLWNLLDQLNVGKALVNDLSASGSVVRDYIFGAEAWAKFCDIAGKDLFGRDGLMDTTLRGSDTKVTRVMEGLEGIEYVGRIQGIDGQGYKDIYVNTQKYRDLDDKDQYMMPQNAVVGVTDAISGYRCFGAIHEKKAQYRALEKFPKMWEEEDPNVEYLMTQSAPLMVPRDPNASFLMMIKVS